MSRIQFPRKHKVEHLGDSRIRITCLTCGWVSVKNQLMGPRGNQKPVPPDGLARLVKFWQANGGATMKCQHCRHLAKKAEKSNG